MNELSIIMYHYVRPIKGSEFPGIKGLELRKFQRQLDHVQENYEVVTSDDLISSATIEGYRLPKNACLLTFDDGYRDHFEYVLPELLHRGLQGSFFPPAKCVTERSMLDVNKIHYILATCDNYEQLVKELEVLCLQNGVAQTDLVQHRGNFFFSSRFDSKEIAYFKRMLQHALEVDVRQKILEELFQKYVKHESEDIADGLYMDTNEVKSLLDQGMYVGNHTYSHKWLNQLPKLAQEQEIDLSLEFLNMIGAPTQEWIMCYPFGGYNSDTLNILTDRKCVVGLTTKSGVASITSRNCLELERYDTNDLPQ
jgi:peptidoglycan/xylan/chitin deacetylase (PgdA/CDA1 family)